MKNTTNKYKLLNNLILLCFNKINILKTYYFTNEYYNIKVNYYKINSIKSILVLNPFLINQKLFNLSFLNFILFSYKKSLIKRLFRYLRFSNSILIKKVPILKNNSYYIFIHLEHKKKNIINSSKFVSKIVFNLLLLNWNNQLITDLYNVSKKTKLSIILKNKWLSISMIQFLKSKAISYAKHSNLLLKLFKFRKLINKEINHKLLLFIYKSIR